MLKRLNTPFYMIDKEELDRNLCEMKKALDSLFRKWIIGYSYKTNSLPWIIRYMNEKDCYAEVVSFDEYHLAKTIGVDESRIIYNGPMKDKETFLEAIRNRCIVNIETWREIDWLRSLDDKTEYKVGLRVNFDIEKYCPGESACGEEGGRFGFCYENGELRRAIEKINGFDHVKLSGLHFHTSSKTRSVSIYHAIATAAVKIIKDYRLQLSYIDIGGGYFGGLPTKPSFYQYFSSIKAVLSQIRDLENITIIVEPGASLIASPISFHTSVIDVKLTNRNVFITTDGSRNDIDPLMTKSNYLFTIEPSDQERRNIIAKQIISGFTCMEHDRLFTLTDHSLLNIGDRIIYDKVGSYTMCLSPLFIKYFPDVYLKDGDEIRRVRSKWTPDEYIQGGIG